VTTNPGAWRDPDTGEIYLLYRASGFDSELRVCFGLAKSTDGIHFERVGEGPVVSPSADGFDAGCIEDPRIVKIGDWFFITYACRPFPPGEYWLPVTQRKYRPPSFPNDFPWFLRENATTTGLLLTKDFKSFIRAGRMTSATNDDRDVVLFPEKVGGKYMMLHRPMNWVGAHYGTFHPGIWLAMSDDLLEWGASRLLAKAELAWEGGKIGTNTPPIKTARGWLTLYHALGLDGRYRVGALLLDTHDPTRVIGRSHQPLLEPEEPYELEGYYNGCVFPCGKVLIEDTLYVYYGAADRCVGLATCRLDELLEDLVSSPSANSASLTKASATLGI